MGNNGTRPWRTRLSSRPAKLAAACIVAVALVATGWGAQEVYSRMRYSYAIGGGGEKPKIALTGATTRPDGTMTGTLIASCQFTTVNSDNPILTPQEIQKEQAEADAQCDRFIAEKQYTFVKTLKTPEGQTEYVYQFPNGNRAFDLPLDEFRSLAQYRQKAEKLRQEREQAIYEAVAEGHYRALDVEPMLVQQCREDGKDIEVLHIKLPDGREEASVCVLPRQDAWRSVDTPWEDHLKAIADGKRQLVDARTIQSWTYEVTLADGSKVHWSVGGQLQPNLKVTSMPAE